MPGEAATNLREIWEALKGAYRELGSPSQFSVLTLNMIHRGSAPFPNLKGKASEVRHLVPALEKVAPLFLDKDDGIEALMIKGLQLSRGIDGCLKDAGRAARPCW